MRPSLIRSCRTDTYRKGVVIKALGMFLRESDEPPPPPPSKRAVGLGMYEPSVSSRVTVGRYLQVSQRKRGEREASKAKAHQPPS